MSLLHKGKSILFLDVETTGIPRKDNPVDIIEVGMKFTPKLGCSSKTEVLSQLYSIGNKLIPAEITEITGITDEMIRGKPHISTHLNALQNRVDRSDVIVAHNAPFDIKCLEQSGLSFANKEVFDTVTHSRRMLPKLERHSLEFICDYMGINNLYAHRAINDVNAMIEIYMHLTDMSIYSSELELLLKKHKKLTYTKKDI